MYPNPREGLRRLVLLLILIAHTGSWVTPVGLFPKSIEHVKRNG
jgi:hypothetical protein